MSPDDADDAALVKTLVSHVTSRLLPTSSGGNNAAALTLRAAARLLGLPRIVAAPLLLLAARDLAASGVAGTVTVLRAALSLEDGVRSVRIRRADPATDDAPHAVVVSPGVPGSSLLRNLLRVASEVDRLKRRGGGGDPPPIIPDGGTPDRADAAVAAAQRRAAGDAPPAPGKSRRRKAPAPTPKVTALPPPMGESREVTNAASFFSKKKVGGTRGSRSQDADPPRTSSKKSIGPMNAQRRTSDSKLELEHEPMPGPQLELEPKPELKPRSTCTKGSREKKERPRRQEERPSSTEKERPARPPARTAKSSGTADDFVGDADSDSDDAAERASKRAKMRRDCAARAPRRRVVEDEEDDEEGPTPVLTPVPAPAPVIAVATVPPARRRRKQLVEKTSVDARGYLYVETVEEWKDIPSEGETEEARQGATRSTERAPATREGAAALAAKSKRGRNTKGMKQAGLMGFFAVKKK